VVEYNLDMSVFFRTDPTGRLICDLSDPEGRHTITAYDGRAAAGELLGALATARSQGLGECFWQEAEGNYRWVFRVEGERMKLSVTWSSSVAVGWKHVLWLETEVAELEGSIRRQLAAVFNTA
jgi:hypothetical protein